MSVTVRTANSVDAAVLIEFNRLMAEETEGKSLDLRILSAGVAAALADPRKGRYYVAELDGRVTGQLLITLEWSDWRNGWIWWIQSVYVRTDSRRHGVFRALYEHVERLAHDDRDVIGLRLYVDGDNRAAQESYRRLGMDQTNYIVFERYPL